MKKERIQSIVKEESLKKTIKQVFDERTINALHSLAKNGYFDYLEYLISPGKEALVFKAVDANGNARAVKIYKVKTSGFREMQKYIEGDKRFEKIKKTKQEIVFAWARKEFKNLQRFYDADVKAPIPYAFKENVLVMEFIGKGEEVAQQLKEKPIEDLQGLYEEIVEYMALMVGKAKLVHADLSEYNILNFEEKAVVIDVGQAVVLSHPNAKEFFERDVKNMAKYFSKQGLEKSFEEMYSDVKTRKNALKG